MIDQLFRQIARKDRETQKAEWKEGNAIQEMAPGRLGQEGLARVCSPPPQEAVAGREQYRARIRPVGVNVRRQLFI